MLTACAFPDYDVQQQAVVPGGGTSGAGTSVAGTSGGGTSGGGAAGSGASGGGGSSAGGPAASCEDNLENGAETDEDCGGDQGCDRCAPGQRCHEVSDCDGGLCTTGQCRAPTCEDELENALETDVDCGGGTCNPCAQGQGCDSNADCDALACVKHVCQAPSCSDLVLNQDETDLDCGGSCSPCADALHCETGVDCQSGVCKQKLCAVPTCSDGVQNGNEPSLDCGSTCPAKCELLDKCSEAADCETQSCKNELCVPSAPTGVPISPVNWTATATTTHPASATKRAFDGIAYTDWNNGTDQVPGAWFLLDLGSPQAFFSLEIDAMSTPSDAAISLDVWFSTDGTFTTPAKQSIPQNAQLVITFAEPQVARFIKLSLAQGTDKWWHIDELRVKQ